MIDSPLMDEINQAAAQGKTSLHEEKVCKTPEEAKIPRPPKPRKWDTMLPKLEELWLGGYSAAECAEIIGQEFSLPITRNSIISAVHRLILRPMNDARRQQQKEEN